jgi:hypothetical protein
MRSSSWDRSGANRDFFKVGPGETAILLDHEGAGCITRVYAALALYDLTDYRDSIIRCFWDGEQAPSVEVPLGDFFAQPHGRARTFRSHMVTVNEGMGATYGMNNYFPMPFATHALVTIENRSDRPIGGGFPALWYHIEFEAHGRPPPDDTLRFHGQWRQEKPTVAVGDAPNVQLHNGTNLTGEENYVALDAAGEGQMVGLVLEVNNVAGGWWGEGDDMVFIDGEGWPPSIHGTGSEEVFGGGACPTTEYAGPYSGFHMIESPDFSGLTGMYRWYVHDPIRFTRSIRWTIEHGHANNFANEYSSVVFWYQREPHVPFPALPTRDELRPSLLPPYEEARDVLSTAVTAVIRRIGSEPDALFRVSNIADRFYRGDFAGFLDAIRAAGLTS